MGKESRDSALSQCLAELFDELFRIAEDQTFLAPVQRREHGCGVGDRSDIVQLDVSGGRINRSRSRSWPRPRPRHERGHPPHLGRDHPGGTPARRRSLQPAQKILRIADGGREPHPLDVPSNEPLQPFDDSEQMPSTIVTGEGVDLVDDDGTKVGEEGAVIDVDADEHRLQRLRRRQQNIGTGTQDGLPSPVCDVPVPYRRLAAEPTGIGGQPWLQVVEQRLERTEVHQRGPAPVFRRHPGQQREQGRFGLAAGGRREQQGVVTADQRRYRLLLERAESRPGECVDDVVEDDRMQQVGIVAHGRSSWTSSAKAALRSTSVSSAAATVNG